MTSALCRLVVAAVGLCILTQASRIRENGGDALQLGPSYAEPVGKKSVEEILEELNSLVGLDKVKEQMKELLAQVEFGLQRKQMGLPDIGGQSLHMAFLGNPGTGKTVVARIVGELLVEMGAIQRSERAEKKIVTEVSRADLVAEYAGQTAPKVNKVFQKALGGVLFIDEAYAVVQSEEDPFGREAVDTLIKLMEDHRDKVVVILAGYRAEMSQFIAANPGFKSRVAFHFNFPDYTCPELVHIGELQMRGKVVSLSPEAVDACSSGAAPEACGWLKSAIRLRTGCCEGGDYCSAEENRANGNGRTVRNILEASYREMAGRVLTTLPPATLSEYDSRFHPTVQRTGKGETPQPPLNCSDHTLAELKSQGPFANLSVMGDQVLDVRCAFSVLDAGDLQHATSGALAEALGTACTGMRMPVKVNVSEVLAQPGSMEKLDWAALHKAVFQERDCVRAQELLFISAPSFLELGKGDAEADCAYCEWMKQKYPTYSAIHYSSKPSAHLCEEFEKESLRRHEVEECQETTTRIMSNLRSVRSGAEPESTCGQILGEQCEQKKDGAASKAFKPPPPLDLKFDGDDAEDVASTEGFPIELQYCEYVMGWFMNNTRIPVQSFYKKLCSRFMHENGMQDLNMRCTDVSRKIFGAIREGTLSCDAIEDLIPEEPSAPKQPPAPSRVRRGNRRFSFGGDEAPLPRGGHGKCALCDHLRELYYGNTFLTLPEPFEYERRCQSIKTRGEVTDEDVLDYCEEVMAQTMKALQSGKMFRCSDLVHERCPQDESQMKEWPFTTDTNIYYKPTPQGQELQERAGSKVESLMQELHELIGLASVKAGLGSVRDAVEFDMWRKKFLGERASLLGQSFHMRFDGNPGTGKTVVARIVGKILVELGVVKKPEEANGPSKDRGFVFREVSRADLVGGYVGHTAPKVQAAVQSAFGGVLFIDEAYSLQQGERDMFGQEAVDTLIKEMEDHRDKLIVIFAGYQQEMDTFFQSNPGFQSRVPFKFEFPDYSCGELVDISKYSLKKQDVVPSNVSEDWLRKVISTKTGCCTQEQLDKGTCAGAGRDNGNGRAVRNILESALRAMAVRTVSTQDVENMTQLVSELVGADVAAVGGELIGEELRTTCKARGRTLTDLASLTTGARILVVPDFQAALNMARTDCDGAHKLLSGAKVDSSLVSNAADVVIHEPSIKEVFQELDEMVGLVSVKKTMREFYCSVEFTRLRAEAGLAATNGQSFHMRFLGNPGTGKTVVARIVGKLLVALGAIKEPPRDEENEEEEEPDYNTPSRVFNEVSRAELVAEYLGQTANKTKGEVKKSLGGVLFLDEAYSLVRDSRDSFGLEAVDTLIKEMEDKREYFVVICAGYEEEMDKFFQSNPGFKSRVPFTFYFEDYTCSELTQIGELGLKKKELHLPENTSAFEESLFFATGCCETLDGCPSSRDKGNGRAVRNVLEASIRNMATRLKGSPPSKELFSQLTAEDFLAVTANAIETRLLPPCRANGDLAKLAQWMEEDQVGVRRRFLGETQLSTTSELARNVRRAEKLRGLGSQSKNICTRCSDLMEEVSVSTMGRLTEYCQPNGTFDGFADEIRTATSQSSIEETANLMKTVSDDVDALRALLEALSAGGEPFDAKETLDECESKLSEMKSLRLPSMDFNPFE